MQLQSYSRATKGHTRTHLIELRFNSYSIIGLNIANRVWFLGFKLFFSLLLVIAHRPPKSKEGIWDPQMQAAPNVVMGLNSTQSSQSTKGSYQLQFAIQQLQQQRLKTHQLLDRDHPRHQVHMQEKNRWTLTIIMWKILLCLTAPFYKIIFLLLNS